MKKILLSAIAVTLTMTAIAQNRFTKEMHQERVQELMKEKIRTNFPANIAETTAEKTTANDKRDKKIFHPMPAE